jgi:hypothetical protein
MTHIHHDTIVAWAADTTQIVQYRVHSGEWVATESPRWRPEYEYRIKPVPKPDVTVEGVVICERRHEPNARPDPHPVSRHRAL